MAPGAARGWLWRRQALPGICHPALLHGGDRVRTDDPLLAKQALSQLSYAPAISDAISDRPVASNSRHGPNMGQGGLEPPTPRLSSVCSNQLSYWPKPCGISRRSLPLSPAPQGGPQDLEGCAAGAPALQAFACSVLPPVAGIGHLGV